MSFCCLPAAVDCDSRPTWESIQWFPQSRFNYEPSVICYYLKVSWHRLIYRMLVYDLELTILTYIGQQASVDHVTRCIPFHDPKILYFLTHYQTSAQWLVSQDIYHAMVICFGSCIFWRISIKWWWIAKPHDTICYKIPWHKQWL